MGFLDRLFGGAAGKGSASGQAASKGAVLAPISGRIESTEAIPDPVFAGEMMGKTVAIWPSEGTLVSPVTGTVVTAMPHALALAADDGLEVLIHVGIDTVNMNGDGFEVVAKQGQRVSAGDKLLEFDREKVAAAGYKDIVMTIVTNSDAHPGLKVVAEGIVAAGTKVMQA